MSKYRFPSAHDADVNSQAAYKTICRWKMGEPPSPEPTPVSQFVDYTKYMLIKLALKEFDGRKRPSDNDVVSKVKELTGETVTRSYVNKIRRGLTIKKHTRQCYIFIHTYLVFYALFSGIHSHFHSQFHSHHFIFPP